MTDEPMATVLYTCHKCNLINKPTTLRARRTGEDVAVWMYVLQRAIHDDHKKVSPKCKSGKLDVKIQIHDECGIGEIPTR